MSRWLDAEDSYECDCWLVDQNIEIVVGCRVYDDDNETSRWTVAVDK